MKGFFSPIERLLEQSTRPKGTGAEFMTELSKKPGYKQAEVEDRDLQTLMALPKMAREEFMAQLKAKPGVVPKERVFRNDPKNLTYEEEYDKQYHGVTGEPHHEDYTLPGGENYREILLQHPKGSFPGVGAHFGGAPNVLASIRVKDRTGPNGEKILHLEEIQSDWHQQGREKDYATKEQAQQLAAARKQAEDAEFQHKQLKRDLDKSKEWSDTLSKRLESGHPDFAVGMPRRAETVNSLQAHNENIMDLMPQVMRADEIHRRTREERDRLVKESSGNVPDAPFKKNWHELALKRMIQHAAENGYDQIAITPGEEQAKRYGLSKHVGMVSYNPDEQHFQAFKPNRETLVNEKGASPERVAELIGKDAATRLMSAPAQMGHHFLEGEDLNVGGEGMKGFYDKMVPKFLNQFGKKYGAQVQPGAVPVVSTPAQHHGLTERQFQAQPPEEQQRMVRQHAYAHEGAKTTVPVHTFDITPEMRADVTKNGIPMYAEGGAVDVPRETNKAKFLEGSHTQQRLYHGTTATEGGKKQEAIRSLKPSKEGALGSGVYLTPDPEFASTYADTSNLSRSDADIDEQSGQNVLPVHARITNPLVIHSKRGEDPMIHALVKLGMHPDKAANMVEKAYEQEGYIGKQVQTRAQAAGHDALMQYRDGKLEEVVHYNPRMIKSAIGNRGTYDTSSPELSKAKGGEVLSPKQREVNKAKFLKGSKVPERVYHGTGNLENLQAFDPAQTGKGTDQLGSGFYFTTDPTEASGYTDRVTQNAPMGASKLGGSESPGVVAAHLAIKKPLRIKGSNLSDAKVNIRHDQAINMLKRAPNINHPEESPLNDFFDTSRTGITNKMLHEVAREYTGSSLMSLGNDFYKNDPTAFRTAIRDVLGYDGVVQDFGEGRKHYVAWFPQQIKSAIGNRGTYDPAEADITKAKGGSVKPAVRGIIKERVTVSPNMDVMQYELMGVKHFTKKAK